MAGSAGGRPSALGARRGSEDVIRLALPAFSAEALRLQVEHRAVASAERHELVVRAELDHAPLLEHADAIRMADGGEPVRNQDRRAVAGRLENAIEDLGLAPHVELRGRLV